MSTFRRALLHRFTGPSVLPQFDAASPSRMKRLLAGCLMLMLALPLQAEDTLTLGVVAYRAKPLIEQPFQPLADYLSEQLGDTRVELQVLDQGEIEDALAHNRLDLLLVNTGHYTLVRSQNALNGVLATLMRSGHGQTTSMLGGVIIARADRADIRELKDLRGKHIATPGMKYLGGYQAHAYEALQEGIDIEHEARLIKTGNHDTVIDAVLSSQADAGFMRTGLIEELTTKGLLDPTRLKVIHRQNLTGYPFAVSTRLYPEFPFIALRHVDVDTTRWITRALLQLGPDHPAARAAGIEGFAPPADYLPVENLARALHMPPYDVVLRISPRDIVRDYAGWILATGTLIVLLAINGLAFLLQNRRLRASRATLSEQTRHLNEVIWGTQIATWQWNVQTGETRFNERWAEIVGYTLDELAPVSIETWTRLTHPGDLAHSGQLLEQCFRRELDTYECEARMRHKDGHWVWVLDRGRVFEWTEDGRPLRMSGTHQDITRRKENELALREQASRLRVFIKRFPGAVLAETADRHILLANQTFCDWFRIPLPPGTLVGMDCSHSAEQAKVLFAEPEAFVERVNQLVLGQDNALGESIDMADGRVLERDYVQVRDGERRVGHVWFYRDITHLKAQQHELEHIAHHDALTGLPNRLLLADRLSLAMAQARRHNTHLAVVYLDLDGFKAVNDTFSHDMGDALLITLATRMQTALRQGETLARMGGDEFVVVLTDLARPDDCKPALGRLLDAASTPVLVDDATLQVSASMGISFYPSTGADADTLLRQADQAMYQAKQGGRNQYRFFGE